MELENRMVSAEWLKDKFYEICDECKCSVVFIDRIIDEIDDAPDVELIQCKDCKWMVEFRGKDSGKPCGYGYCKNPIGLMGIAYNESMGMKVTHWMLLPEPPNE